MILQARSLLLRDFVQEDVPVLARYQADPRYLEHYGNDRIGAETIVKMALAWAREEPRASYQLAVVLGEQNELIGTVGLRRSSARSREAEFGCEINPDYWRRGYAREASIALLDFGFAHLDLSSVIARTVPTNARVHGLLGSLGFEEAADGVEDGEFCWVLTRDRWRHGQLDGG